MSFPGLLDGPADAASTILLAHGAGAPMDSPAMTAMTQALTSAGLRVVRFEFAYMASRRGPDGPKPPPRAETLVPEYRSAIAALAAPPGLIIGGKSLGGRVASLIADDLYAAGTTAGLVCLGYPFHPPGRPEKLRTRHLADLRSPALICQGTRDPFGNRDEVAGYALSDRIKILWLEDGDHDMRPRKRLSGFTLADHLKTVGEGVAAWAAELGR
jgi:predicted alpha/beta-hydrolase family hydrolase